jgi:thiol-disulfide isomerase/thioredoxin
MLSISLGPLALPVAPVALLLAAWGASALASFIARRAVPAGTQAETEVETRRAAAAASAESAVLQAVLLGLLAARLAHLALHADVYALAPVAALDIRDGGWNPLAGSFAGSAWLLWRGWRAPALRRALALAALAGLSSWWAVSAAITAPSAPELPALAVMPLHGTASVTLPEAARGRPVVVNLWATWCAPCRQEMPTLAAAQQRHPSVGILFVNQGETAATVRSYLSANGLDLHDVLLDSRSALGPAVGSRGLPTTLFYDSRGRLIDAHFGVLNAPALEARMQRLRAAR